MYMLDLNTCGIEELIGIIKGDKNSPALDVLISRFSHYINSLLNRFSVEEDEKAAGLTLGSFAGMVYLLIAKFLRGDRDLLPDDLVIRNDPSGKSTKGISCKRR